MKRFRGTVQRFPGHLGWHYVDVPDELVPSKRRSVKWGLIPCEFQVGDTRWKSSLLPKGGGTYFVALKASVRKREAISLGDTVTVRFQFV